MTLALRLSNRLLIRPLLRQDGFAVEAEQRGHEAHPRQPVPDLNPAVALFQQLTLRKWEEHLARAGTRPGPSSPSAPPAPEATRAQPARS
jgi:hypothetical protein